MALAVAVPASRARPAAAVFLVNAVCAAGLASSTPTFSPYLLALAVLTYLLGHRSDATTRALTLFITCLAVHVAVCAVLKVDAVYWFYTVTMVPVALLLPWLTGRHRRARAELVHGGWERADHLERQQQVAAEQARLRERARIAADVHDSLGHELSLIALRAGALELSPTLSDHDRSDLAELRASIADSVGHLHATIGVLQDDVYPSGDPEPTASPTESVEMLIARARQSGVSAELHRDGPAPDLAPLVHRTLYRVVQESLTNAVRHAPGSIIRVHLTSKDNRTDVRISNPASAATLPTPAPAGSYTALNGSSHRGLTGLRERVHLIGGTFHAGPHDGGYLVQATLPDQVTAQRQTRNRNSHQEHGESQRRHVRARRVDRQRFVAAFAAPAALGLVVLLSALVLARQLTTCVLEPADYEHIQPGQDRAVFAHLLPDKTFPYPPDVLATLPPPPGSTCEYYRSNGNLLSASDLYRLCFSGSHLTEKATLPN
ncbi:sensor histidine kinase [Streptomyces sp. NPDC093093]|uniref:sensor histidine kinase n=1 Tax=Streptomyces sp. NPDC093093 TaxID=3366025 RepID=UPI003827EABF